MHISEIAFLHICSVLPSALTDYYGFLKQSQHKGLVTHPLESGSHPILSVAPVEELWSLVASLSTPKSHGSTSRPSAFSSLISLQLFFSFCNLFWLAGIQITLSDRNLGYHPWYSYSLLPTSTTGGIFTTNQRSFRLLNSKDLKKILFISWESSWHLLFFEGKISYQGRWQIPWWNCTSNLFLHKVVAVLSILML